MNENVLSQVSAITNTQNKYEIINKQNDFSAEFLSENVKKNLNDNLNFVGKLILKFRFIFAKKYQP